MTITGPSGANQITIQKGTGSTATVGLRFSGFDLSPVGSSLTELTGVSNLSITGFGTGIEVASLSSTNFNFELPLKIVGNEITNNTAGISINNSDIPFRIEGNRIVGTSPTAGLGITLTNSDQTVVNLPAAYKPTIGNSDVANGGNVIGSFSRGIFVQNSSFPDLRISGNRIGVDDDLHGQNELPNNVGIDVALGSTTSKIGRIDHNDIVYNLSDGIRFQETDGVVIENNLIGANGGDGIDLSLASGNHTIRNNTFYSNGDNGVDGDGVTIHPLTSGTDASQIEISGNDFLGIKPWAQPIDLRNDGPTGNDPNDFDSGVNGLQNYPVIGSIKFDGSTWTVPVTLDVAGSSQPKNFRFEFYRYDASLKNYRFINSKPVTIPAQMDFSGSFTFANGSELNVGDEIGVIAIRNDVGTEKNNTSEFAPRFARVMDVKLYGVQPNGTTPWARPAYSYGQIMQTSSQLAPIPTQGVNTLQIKFNEHVRKISAGGTISSIASNTTDGNSLLELRRTVRSANGVVTTATVSATGFSYDPVTHIGTWTFSPTLVAGKYAINLRAGGPGVFGIVNVGGKGLDGEWVNDLGMDPTNMLPSPDEFSDDPIGRSLQSGTGEEGGAFTFYFSLLPGDSRNNQDGAVTASDALLANVADVNGDNAFDTNDITLVNQIITDATSTSLPLRNRFGPYSNLGDYNDNEIVDQGDYLVWKANFGSVSNLAADGNGNGVVDAGDYSPWLDNFGKESLWKFGAGSGSGGGSGIPVFDPNNFPRVANVTISGSSSPHAPFSFNGPDDNTDFDGSGIQLRTVPVGGADTISITFTEDVNIAADMLKLTGMRTANRPILADFSYDLGTMTARWRFSSWALGDQYLISLSDAVTDVEGNSLDGEWTNPRQLSTVNGAVSKFPSGNGYAGGDFNFVVTLLPGDANLDGLVNSTDYYIFSSNTGYGALFTLGDFNGDGQVSYSGDGQILIANFNLNLATPLFLVADLNGDWKVDDDDLNILGTNLGTSSPTAAQGDLDHDNDIDSYDLDLMFAQYGLELAVVG